MDNNEIGYLIKSINDKIKIKADKQLISHDLTLAQSRVLWFVDDRGGTTTQKDIGEFLDVTNPTVAGIVSRMQKNGYLDCYPDKNDKRIKVVRLTDKARSVGKEMEQIINAQEAHMTAGLSDGDTAELKMILQKINNNLK